MPRCVCLSADTVVTVSSLHLDCMPLHGSTRFTHHCLCTIKHICVNLYRFRHAANTHTHTHSNNQLKDFVFGYYTFLYVSISIPLSVFNFLVSPPPLFCLSMFHFSLFGVLDLSGPSVSSLERSSPLPEGRSRSLRSSRPFGSPSVTVVKMTPLSFLPGTRIIKYLGIINMFFIRETTSLREVRPRAPAPGQPCAGASSRGLVCLLQEGGVSGFLHSFIAEVFAMVRAHVAALGGNAVVSYSMKECVFMENPNKNQVHTQHTFVCTSWPDLQCLILSDLERRGLVF